jgi:hypothetical protein
MLSGKGTKHALVLLLGFSATIACGPRDRANKTDTAGGSTPAPQPGGAAPVTADPVRQWTVLVYMNGDNNLEEFALRDFREMARIGSTNDVNIVVQFDRVPGYNDDAGDWTDTRRFRVEKGMEPVIASADPTFAQEVDMGNRDALRDFVQWGMKRYPAERNALVIWDHGDGFRFFVNRPGLTREERNKRIAKIDSLLVLRTGSFDRKALATALAGTSDVDLAGPVSEHPVKAASHDETSGNVLFNRAIESALGEALQSRRLDILGFDACLMAMLENAYAFRNVANVLVASEELEPGDGWHYERVLGPLVANPQMTDTALGRQIVKAYETTYGAQQQKTTLSAIDLRRIEPVAAAASAFADGLDAALGTPQLKTQIRAARMACNEYAPGDGFHNIDLKCFTARLTSISDPSIRALAVALEQARTNATLAAYADKTRNTPAYVSAGLAIYYPRSGADYNNDPLHLAYRDGLPMKEWPVQFVDDFRWDEFLARFASTFP